MRAFWGRRGWLGKTTIVVLGVFVALVLVGSLLPSEGDEVEASHAWLTFSRDGRHVAFASDRSAPGKGFALYTARLGGRARAVSRTAHHHSWPALSPDGSKIAFSRSKHGDWLAPLHMYVVNADGTGLRRLTKGDDWAPAWSPDGRAIAFTRGAGIRSYFSTVYLVNADGTGLRRIVRDGAEPDWSPDGRKIALVRGVNDSIEVFDLGTETVVTLVRSKRASAAEPAWSPDGKRIAFVDIPGGALVEGKYGEGDFYEIYVVNADGTELRRLTHNAEMDASPTWTPDGRIVFERTGAGPSRSFVMNPDVTAVHPFRVTRESSSSSESSP